MDELMMMENPYGFSIYNPKRRKNKMAKSRALAIPGERQLKRYTMGVGIMDAGMGLAGVAGATMLPGYVVKDTSTNTNKLLSSGASLLSAVAIGAAAKAVVNAEAAKAAVIGGLAGFVAHTILLFSGKSLIGGVVGRNTVRRIGESTVVSNSISRDGERVSVIQP